MSRAKLLEDLKAASGDFAAARLALTDEQIKARHGMAHNLMFATSREHVAYHRWLHAHEKLTALQPVSPSSKAAPAAAKIATVTTALPSAPTNNVEPFDLLGHLNDRCDASEKRWRAMSGLLPRRSS